jgi:tRNA threonylcarbamoyladenosine biosynthesis protein TsaE
MEKEYITENSEETQSLGLLMAKEIRFGGVILLSGDLGAGKTTLTQGLLSGLNVPEPYTSPTFVIMKKYGLNIYHFDAYRVEKEDILNLGWEEIMTDMSNIVIVEWAERIREIAPKGAYWVDFLWMDENRRKIKIQRI